MRQYLPEDIYHRNEAAGIDMRSIYPVYRITVGIYLLQFFRIAGKRIPHCNDDFEIHANLRSVFGNEYNLLFELFNNLRPRQPRKQNALKPDVDPPKAIGYSAQYYKRQGSRKPIVASHEYV